MFCVRSVAGSKKGEDVTPNKTLHKRYALNTAECNLALFKSNKSSYYIKRTES